MTSQLLRTFVRARIVQFAAIGGVLFAVARSPRDDRRIEISSRAIATTQSAEAARHGAVALDAAKAAEVRARLIEDEMLYREGLRLGLDQDDPLIRQRVVQKVLLLAEELGGAMREPTRAELKAEYARTRDTYRTPPRFHLMHVFANRAEDLPAIQTLPLDALPNAGEPFPLPRETTAAIDELRRSYGDDFAALVAVLPASFGYSKPVHSTYGWHRVRVVEAQPGRVPAFAEVERQVAFELALRRREDTVRKYLTETAARYEIVIDGEPVEEFTPTVRLARRDDASAED